MATRLVFTGKQNVQSESFDPGKPGDDEILLRNVCTLMSTGTENIVFNRLFDPGTHWDQWVKYPFYPGYCAIGEVVEAGAKVKDLKPGQLVAHRGGHASAQRCKADEAYPVPAEVLPEDAVWFGLAKIAFMGAKAIRYNLGDSVLVAGAGPIGQMTVRWANAAGVSSLVCVDPMAKRLELALKGGASRVFAKGLSEAPVPDVVDACGGELPAVVVDATGNAAVFTEALRFARKFGRVLLLGDTGSPAQQHLSSDVICKGLTIMGAHDPHTTAEWSESRIVQLFFTLVRMGRFNVDGLNTHTFDPSQPLEAYRVANKDRGNTMGILFNWRAS